MLNVLVFSFCILFFCPPGAEGDPDGMTASQRAASQLVEKYAGREYTRVPPA